MKDLLIHLLLFAIGLSIGLSLKQCREPNPKNIIKIERDTVMTYHYDTITVEKIKPIVYRDTIWMPAPESTDTLSSGDIRNVYQDTSYIENNYYLFYTADVTGRLNFIDLGYYDNRQDSVTVKTVVKRVDNYISPRGLYAGGHVTIDGNIIPGAMYMWNKSAVGVGYNLNQGQVQIGYFRKLK